MGSLARSIVPPGPVLWPVLAEPSRMYQRLSNPRWGCLVSTPASSESRKRLSWTRMNGSTLSYGTLREGRGSRISKPIIGRMWACSTSTASREARVSCCTFLTSVSSGAVQAPLLIC